MLLLLFTYVRKLSIVVEEGEDVKTKKVFKKFQEKFRGEKHKMRVLFCCFLNLSQTVKIMEIMCLSAHAGPRVCEHAA